MHITDLEMFLGIKVDKKVADGLLRLILLKGPLGNCIFTGDYDRKALDETLHAFCKSWVVSKFGWHPLCSWSAECLVLGQCSSVLVFILDINQEWLFALFLVFSSVLIQLKCCHNEACNFRSSDQSINPSGFRFPFLVRFVPSLQFQSRATREWNKIRAKYPCFKSNNDSCSCINRSPQVPNHQEWNTRMPSFIKFQRCSALTWTTLTRPLSTDRRPIVKQPGRLEKIPGVVLMDFIFPAIGLLPAEDSGGEELGWCIRWPAGQAIRKPILQPSS